MLRLFPALIAATVLTVLAGAFFTTLPLAQYLTAPATLSYVPRNLSLAFLQYPLPGVFENNPLPRSINGSLWTLFYEVVCYCGVAVLGLLGVLRRPRAFSLAFALIASAFVLGDGWEPEGGLACSAKRLLTLAFPFALGMLAYVWRGRLRLDFRLAAALWVLPLLAHGTILQAAATTLALAYTAACFGFLPRGASLAYNRLGDYFYGTYLYAFPVQQAMAHVFPCGSPLANMLLAFPITLMLAVLSWHLVEERALGLIRIGPVSPDAAPAPPLRSGQP